MKKSERITGPKIKMLETVFRKKKPENNKVKIEKYPKHDYL